MHQKILIPAVSDTGKYRYRKNDWNQHDNSSKIRHNVEAGCVTFRFLAVLAHRRNIDFLLKRGIMVKGSE